MSIIAIVYLSQNLFYVHQAPIITATAWKKIGPGTSEESLQTDAQMGIAHFMIPSGDGG